MKAWTVSDLDSGAGNCGLALCNFICSPKKGLFAALANGFWWVGDRIKAQSAQLKPAVAKIVQSETDRIAKEAVPDACRTEVTELPHIQNYDYLACAIDCLEKQSLRADMPLEVTLSSALRKICYNVKVVSEVMKGLHGFHISCTKGHEVKAGMRYIYIYITQQFSVFEKFVYYIYIYMYNIYFFTYIYIYIYIW